MTNATVDVVAPKCFILPVGPTAIAAGGFISGMMFISGAEVYVTYGPATCKKMNTA